MFNGWNGVSARNHNKIERNVISEGKLKWKNIKQRFDLKIKFKILNFKKKSII